MLCNLPNSCRTNYFMVYDQYLLLRAMSRLSEYWQSETIGKVGSPALMLRV